MILSKKTEKKPRNREKPRLKIKPRTSQKKKPRSRFKTENSEHCWPYLSISHIWPYLSIIFFQIIFLVKNKTYFLITKINKRI
jgi:hypothetical protein